MSELKQLLYADLMRQYEIEGKTEQHPNLYRFFKRFLHFRFLPNVLCRTSRSAMLMSIPVLPQLLTYLNIVLFGLEVTPKCQIGPGLFIAHPVGTVIGASRLGSNVTVFQGVTLGSKLLDRGFNPETRPRIGSDVVLGSGCKVLGGISVGDHSIVGANAVVIASVDAYKTVVGVPARVISSSLHSEIRSHANLLVDCEASVERQ